MSCRDWRLRKAVTSSPEPKVKRLFSLTFCATFSDFDFKAILAGSTNRPVVFDFENALESKFESLYYDKVMKWPRPGNLRNLYIKKG